MARMLLQLLLSVLHTELQLSHSVLVYEVTAIAVGRGIQVSVFTLGYSIPSYGCGTRFWYTKLQLLHSEYCTKLQLLHSEYCTKLQLLFRRLLGCVPRAFFILSRLPAF